ncbi:torsin-1A-interacting protein 1 isoform X3 [Tachyglossus aculeatus]|uniref:torsin-1A-interacting protein 1 isoform X3 n=1 Tax=Tachyglossus aculeatus TaxID=9261 RepID=UPI0018F3B551|nr:torsin-1A-interacting protein 1 isoform X3 [Tachyglossus aculeatus]
MAGEGWAARVTPRAALREGRRRPPSQNGGGGGCASLPREAPWAPAGWRRPRREVRFSDLPPEVCGGGGGGDPSPPGTPAPAGEEEARDDNASYPRARWRRRPREAVAMKTRRFARLQERRQRLSPPTTRRRALQDSQSSDEDEPTSQTIRSHTVSTRSIKRTQGAAAVVSVGSESVADLCRPPIRSSGSEYSSFGTNGDTKLNETEKREMKKRQRKLEAEYAGGVRVQKVDFSEEGETGEEENQDSSGSEGTSAKPTDGDSASPRGLDPDFRPLSKFPDSFRKPVPNQDYKLNKQSETFWEQSHVPPSTTKLQEWSDQKTHLRTRLQISKSLMQEHFSDVDDSHYKLNVGNKLTAHVKKEPTGQSKERTSAKIWLWVIVTAVILAACVLGLWSRFMPDSSLSGEITAVQRFQLQMKQLMNKYPSQDEKLWKRSQIFLEKHLNSSHPRLQPAILLLTAARDAEEVLRCLSERIADAYSSSFSVSAIRIDGAGRAAQNSDAVKMEMDSQLNDGFRNGKKAAVVHRFESLPAGSTLIFYKYCDHENAAFKEVALVLTVLLEEEETLGTSPDLKEIEEKVRDFLKVKFTKSDTPNSYNRMDSDKLSGLWSRISHLVLPVQPENALKRGSCL